MLLLAIAAEVVATTSLKYSQGFRVLLPSLLVVAGYGSAFYLLSRALLGMSLGVAYAVWSGLGTLLVCLLGAWLFGESLSLTSWLGIALILVGVAVLNLAGGHG